MNLSPINSIDIVKRRLMLYKAIKEFPDNQRIRNTLIRTYAKVYLREAVQDGIYISYSRADELFALELATSLRQADVNVWLDQIDVEPDEDWEYAIATSIKRSGVMLYILSPHAIKDEQSQHELTLFMESGKIVIPILYEPCQFDTQKIMIPPISFVEDFDTGLQILLKSIIDSSPVNA